MKSVLMGGHALSGQVRRHLGPVMGTVMAPHSFDEKFVRRSGLLDEIDPGLVRPARVFCQPLDAMGWIALLAAALYYHPWLSLTLIGVVITLIGVIIQARRQT